MRSSRRKIAVIGALRSEQPVDHLLCPGRPVDLEAWGKSADSIPLVMYQTRQIPAVVEVQMRQEHVRYVLRAFAGLHEAMKRAWAVIEQDHVASDFYHVARGTARERRDGGPGAKKGDLQFIASIAMASSIRESSRYLLSPSSRSIWRSS